MIQPTRRAIVLVAAAAPLSLAVAALDADLWPIGLTYLLFVLALIAFDSARALPTRRLSVSVRPIDSLFIGEDVDASAAAAGKRIPQEGEGTRVTIPPGSTMVFTQADSYVRIARGSQIFAEGTAAAPITFTADEDVILSVANENSRGLWGGVQINGNGMTNKCHDGTATGNAGVVGNSDFDATANNVHSCHVTAEGRPATYGGGNNAENSGVLTYVVIKYAGYEVVDGNELNALTLNAVGNGTTINHVETYTTLDDGFEMLDVEGGRRVFIVGDAVCRTGRLDDAAEK